MPKMHRFTLGARDRQRTDGCIALSLNAPRAYILGGGHNKWTMFGECYHKLCIPFSPIRVSCSSYRGFSTVSACLVLHRFVRTTSIICIKASCSSARSYRSSRLQQVRISKRVGHSVTVCAVSGRQRRASSKERVMQFNEQTQLSHLYTRRE